MLGITTAETLSQSRFTNIRRQVFYFYPNGAAPLVGLLSMMSDEITNDPAFSWFEKRLSTQTTVTAPLNAAGPFGTSGSNTDKSSPWSGAAASYVRVAVVNNGTSVLRLGHRVQLKNVPISGGGTVDIQGRVDSLVDGTTNKFELQLDAAVANVVNDNTANNIEVWVIGSAFEEGREGSSGNIWTLPVQPQNVTQIFRTEFSFTGTAIKTSLKFDESGPYKDKAKEHSIMHMTEIEKNFLFARTMVVRAQQNGMPLRFTKGVIGFLLDWEAGSVYGNAAAYSDADDNKRIINNTAGTISLSVWEDYVERAFRVTNNTNNEKLCLCGSGFIKVMNQMFVNVAGYSSIKPSDDTFGMSLTQYVSPFGTIYFKSHPLFSQNPRERYNAMFVDMGNMKYRYIDGRDTDILTDRQPNNADYRTDEWFTEGGLELRYPEAMLYLQNCRSFIP